MIGLKNIKFSKYHGTGNDFVMIDNRTQKLELSSPASIQFLCDRRFGIGADGLILLDQSATGDLRMVYFNSDGYEGSMCGNGGRCFAAFAAHLGLVTGETKFDAIDGVHFAKIKSAITNGFEIALKMSDVDKVEKIDQSYILDTGSPHFVCFRDRVADVDVYNDGRAIRYNDQFKQKGINVNFVEPRDGSLTIRTYERGVENETWSCGTGSAAAAIALKMEGYAKAGEPIEILSKGGKLFVTFQQHENKFTDIWLNGPAVKVFDGTIEIQEQ